MTVSSKSSRVAVHADGPIAAKTISPVKVWAVIGGLFAVFEVYVFAYWFISGDATPTPQGPTPVGPVMKPALVLGLAAGIVAALAIVYRYALQPWRRERQLTLDGILCLTCLLLVWQDPLVNYTQVVATYNTWLPNLGSWGHAIPGWVSPRGNLFAEPFLLSPFLYIWMMFGGMIFGCYLMRRAKQRWPGIGPLGQLGLVFAAFAILDLVAEVSLMRIGIYSYGGSVRWLTIYHGRYYQFPVYEAAAWPFCWVALTAIRHFTDDRGRTIAERGIEKLSLTGSQLGRVRFLAIFGLMNVTLLVGYNVPFQIWALHADTWPEDVQRRSYFTSGICGPGTDYECSSPGVPIPRRESLHVDPTGSLAP